MIPLQELHTERERLVRILTAVERLIESLEEEETQQPPTPITSTRDYHARILWLLLKQHHKGSIAIPLRDATFMPTDWELRVDECYGATPSILVNARTSGKEGAA